MGCDDIFVRYIYIYANVSLYRRCGGMYSKLVVARLRLGPGPLPGIAIRIVAFPFFSFLFLKFIFFFCSGRRVRLVNVSSYKKKKKLARLASFWK